MRIDGKTPLSGVQARGTKKTGGSSSSSFVLTEETETQASSGMTSMTSVQGLDVLLALQGIGEEGERRRKAKKHGNELLDALEDLKIELLGGQVSVDRLERLASHVVLRQPSGDSGLDAVLDEIELRVRVELAKLGKFVDQ